LAKLGHHCVGVDFSPASIAYARKQAEIAGLAIEYVLTDIRGYAHEQPFNCILMTFGEFNVFTRQDACGILKNCAGMLEENGLFLLETHTYEAVRASGETPASWQRHASGLFSDAPHLCLQENGWNASDATAFSRYYIVDAASADVRQYASFMQAYTDEEYDDILRAAGFTSWRILDAEIWPVGDDFQGKLQVFVAEKG
jgi:cyclopropane fatty-acyl-phospholipid synthase-like methyltransferase